MNDAYQPQVRLVGQGGSHTIVTQMS